MLSNRSILGNIGTGEIFGEAYVAPESGTLLMVVQNLFFAISEKNRSLYPFEGSDADP